MLKINFAQTSINALVILALTGCGNSGNSTSTEPSTGIGSPEKLIPLSQETMQDYAEAAFMNADASNNASMVIPPQANSQKTLNKSSVFGTTERKPSLDVTSCSSGSTTYISEYSSEDAPFSTISDYTRAESSKCLNSTTLGGTVYTDGSIEGTLTKLSGWHNLYEAFDYKNTPDDLLNYEAELHLAFEGFTIGFNDNKTNIDGSITTLYSVTNTLHSQTNTYTNYSAKSKGINDLGNSINLTINMKKFEVAETEDLDSKTFTVNGDTAIAVTGRGKLDFTISTKEPIGYQSDVYQGKAVIASGKAIMTLTFTTPNNAQAILDIDGDGKTDYSQLIILDLEDFENY